MSSSRRELPEIGDKQDRQGASGASAAGSGQRAAAPGEDAGGRRGSPPRDAQRDDGRGRDARRNGSDSGGGKG